MKILGNPANSRDFLYIDDAVAALVDSVGQPGNFVGETFNIASGYECNLVELARLVCELTGKSFSNLVSVEQTGPPVRFCADISKARQQLSFSPRVDLREGLERVLASFSAV
jgi:UDP-glucuronate decarboxylase